MGASKKSPGNQNGGQLLASNKFSAGSVKKTKAMKSLSKATPKSLATLKKNQASSVGSGRNNGKAGMKLNVKTKNDDSDESDDDDDNEDMQIDDSDEDIDFSDSENGDSDEVSNDSDEDEGTKKSKKSVKLDKKKASKVDGSDKKPSKKQKSDTVPKKGELIEDNSNRTMFVSRLKKGTTCEQLKTFVVSKGFAVVDCRKVAQAAFGFIQFATITELDMAVSTLQNAKFGDVTISVAKSKPPGSKKVERDAKSLDKKSSVSESRKSKKNKQHAEKKKARNDKLSLFVKNIGQSATKELIQKQFPGVQKVIVGRKQTGATRGFALLRFENEEQVLEALKKYQGVTMDGRELHVDRAGAYALTKPAGKKAEAEKPSITVNSDDYSSDEE